MKKTIFKFIGLTLIVVSLFVCGLFVGIEVGEAPYKGDITRELPAEMREASLELTPWFSDAVGFRVGKYSVYAPNKPGTSEIMVIGEDRVIIADNRSVSITDTYNQASLSVEKNMDEPYLGAVSYTTLNENGKRSGETTDWNRDGQAETKYHKSGKIEYWVQGKWYEKKPKSNPPVVFVNGEWIELGTPHPGKYDFRFKD